MVCTQTRSLCYNFACMSFSISESDTLRGYTHQPKATLSGFHELGQLFVALQSLEGIWQTIFAGCFDTFLKKK